MFNIKRTIYISAFTVLGVLLQFMVHALIEIWYIGLLVDDFATFGLGLSWNAWFRIHAIGTVVLIVLGIMFGYWQGKYWWPRIYEKHKTHPD